jgi:superfamily II DNA helicase RecQ
MSSVETINDVYKRLFSSVMQKSYGKTPHQQQLDVALPLMHMVKNTGGMYPSSFFCILPTGKGKPLVRDTISRLLCGVTVTISPLLSLSADQVSKLLHMSTCSADKGFKVFHLDEITAPDKQRALAEIIIRLAGRTTDTRVAISLFVSPQAVKRETWIRNLFDAMIKSSLLRLVCLDEIHIFLEHALNFRDAFSDLKTSLFNKLHVKGGKKSEM